MLERQARRHERPCACQYPFFGEAAGGGFRICFPLPRAGPRGRPCDAARTRQDGVILPCHVPSPRKPSPSPGGLRPGVPAGLRTRRPGPRGPTYQASLPGYRDPVLMKPFVSAYRCGAVPDLHRIPFSVVHHKRRTSTDSRQYRVAQQALSIRRHDAARQPSQDRPASWRRNPTHVR